MYDHSIRINRLVAFRFVINYDDKKTEVDHWDNNVHNNHISNLRWASSKENCNNKTNNKKQRK